MSKDRRTERLDDLLVVQGQQDWQARLATIRNAIRQATWFEDGSPEDTQLCQIIQAVRKDGDRALLEYTSRYDGVTMGADQIRVPRQALQDAHGLVESQILSAIRSAIANVRRYQSEIFIPSRIRHPGIRFTALQRVGICVPGASAPLASTVIMTAVPAQVAGVRQIAVVCPPRHHGDIHPMIMAVCWELGIEEVYRIGGAQAVAALAFGTETIRPVDKIVGPGNSWVQMAKRRVFGQVDIDSIAGPSEVVIIANDQANSTWVAADMLSQAEHAPGVAVLLTDSMSLARAVLEQLRSQLGGLSRADTTIDYLIKYGAIVVLEDLDQAVDVANDFAPEHLEIHCGDQTRDIASRITNAGAIFIGPYSPVAIGDYWAGPSHTLPTGQTARFFSPLSSNDFIKSLSLIEYDKSMLQQAADDIIRLALLEGLDAHAHSVQIRFKG
ncbi:MAG: histidinol dehydrogenase [Sedimentisphaerales bacterium]|nr:histidinol dehydrogenase [Sedimentisphaerales bacterium]